MIENQIPSMHPGQSSFANGSSFASGCMSALPPKPHISRHSIGREQNDPSAMRQASNGENSSPFDFGPSSRGNSPGRKEPRARFTQGSGQIPSESTLGNRITSTSKIPSKQMGDSVQQRLNFAGSGIGSSYLQGSIPNEHEHSNVSKDFQNSFAQSSRSMNALS